MTGPAELFDRLVVEGPIAVAAGSAPLGRAHWPERHLGVDLDAAGYVEEEFVVRGLADLFGYDDALEAEVIERGIAFTTRILVRRPADADRCSGLVALEPNHSDADRSITWGAIAPWLLRNGHVHVGITQEHSIVGELQRFDPERYGGLSIDRPGLGWDIVGLVALLLRSGRPDDPLAGVGTRSVLSGWSQTGTFCRTFLGDRFDERWRLADGQPVIDAYVICISSGGALRPGYTPLSYGQPVLAWDDERRTIGPHSVPVIELLSEGEAETHRAVLRADTDGPSDQYRLYEVAGTSHVATGFGGLATNHAQLVGRGWPERPRDIVEEPSTARLDFVARAVFAAVDDWVQTGEAPPRAPRFEYLSRRAAGVHGRMAEALPIVRDDDGNAVGGVRTPWVDVPAATYLPHSTPRPGACLPADSAPYTDPAFLADLIGHMVPYSEGALERRYLSRSGYMTRFVARCEELVAERWLLPEEADQLIHDTEERIALTR